MATWGIDLAHSDVTFKVKHLMITNVTGAFRNFTVTAETKGDDFTQFTAKAEIETASVDTGNKQRDAHITAADFFNSEKFPHITFVSTKYESVDGDGSYELYGDLTIMGVTKPVKLEVEFGGVVKDPYGNIKAGFSVNGKINRQDFGLSWNAALETGGVVISNDVRISADIELTKTA